MPSDSASTPAPRRTRLSRTADGLGAVERSKHGAADFAERVGLTIHPTSHLAPRKGAESGALTGRCDGGAAAIGPSAQADAESQASRVGLPGSLLVEALARGR
jgi:hypothetical protein